MKLVYYPPENSRRPDSPMYPQRTGPRSANQIRRQDADYFYPNEMQMRGNARGNSRFHPEAIRREDAAYFYPNEMMRGQGAPNYYSNQMRRRGAPEYYPNEVRGQGTPDYYPNQMQGQQPPPNQQRRPSRFERLPDHFNTLVGHMGTINNGIQMMRQFGSILNIFRR